MATAKFTDRFLAYLIDALPFVAGYHISVYVLARRGADLPVFSGGWSRVLACWIGLYVLYHAVCNLTGASIGKRMLGLRVTAQDGSRLGPAASFVRAIGLLISTPFFNLGFLWALVQPETRAWHDLLAGSRVVEERPKTSGEALGNAILSFFVLAGIGALSWWIASAAPTPADREAIRKAREGLNILARIEQRYRARNGTYADSLTDLAETSGDFGQFRSAMREIFDEQRFRISAGRDRFILTARARDRRKTEVSVSGP